MSNVTSLFQLKWPMVATGACANLDKIMVTMVHCRFWHD